MAKSSSKNRNSGSNRKNETQQKGFKKWLLVAAVLVVAAIVTIALLARDKHTNSKSLAPEASTSPVSTPEQPTPASELVTMDVAKAIMVTAELDFGAKIPTIEEALTQIERRYQPEDGQGRTFAVLDAYGEPTPDGKLHISMHVSSEKPGGGQLIFKRTGEVLWRGKINPTSQPIQQKNLTILLDNGKGTTLTVDGSTNPASVIEATLKPGNLPVKDIWPDGQERELTFIYSACGCPVHVLAKRVGDRTVRVKDTPVIFPDDPKAVEVIARLMKW
jgi:hypothetical protein